MSLSPFFTPLLFSICAALLHLKKKELKTPKKRRKKSRHGLIRQSAARSAPRLGAGLRHQVSFEGSPAAVRAGGAPAVGEGRAGEPERGAGVREAAGDVPGEV